MSVIKSSQLMLYREIIAVCSQIHTKHINTLFGQNVELTKFNTSGTYDNHWSLKGCISVIKTSQLMVYSEIIAVCSQIHTKHINTLCGQNVDLLNVKPGGTYSNHWSLEGYMSVIKTSQSMLYREIIAVCSQIHTKYINTLFGQNVELMNFNTCGTYSNHWNLKCCISVIKTSHLIMYREIIAVCSQIYTKHINTLCRQKGELLNVKLAVHILTTGA